MKSALKYFALISAIATFLTIFGMWGRITHRLYANEIFTAGMWMLAVCAGIYVYIKISRFNNKN
ncbi:MAG: hypothetical protein WCI49_01895 [Ferruginibacter sp.]